MKHQRGGTFLGLVMGLVMGLAIALGVTLYIKNAPLPFMDKGVQVKPAQTATDIERLREWNPNTAIAPSKPPVLTPPSEEAPTAPSATEPGATTSDAAPPSPSANTPLDALGDLMREKTQAPAKDPFSYYVQAGAFREKAEADGQRAKLGLQGWQANISEREQAGKPLYRVRLGPYKDKAEADKVQQTLSVQGFDSSLVRVKML